jgi:hypothetical protein
MDRIMPRKTALTVISGNGLLTISLSYLDVTAKIREIKKGESAN